MAASVIGICICCYQSGKEVSFYQKLADTCKVGQEEESRMPVGDIVTDKEEKEETEDMTGGETKMEKEEENLTEPQEADIQISYDWKELLAINQDVLGWLYLPGSLIDFPVTGTEDNSFYLSHDFSGEKSRGGCLFMDKDTEMSDFNRVIYGHNMGRESEAVFSTLLRFEEEDYFEENRYFYFTETGGATSVYEIIAVVKYDVKDTGEWDFRVRNHAAVESCLEFMGQMKERALYYRGDVEMPERLLILSTCDRREYGKDGRFLVIGAAW